MSQDKNITLVLVQMTHFLYSQGVRTGVNKPPYFKSLLTLTRQYPSVLLQLDKVPKIIIVSKIIRVNMSLGKDHQL